MLVRQVFLTSSTTRKESFTSSGEKTLKISIDLFAADQVALHCWIPVANKKKSRTHEHKQTNILTGRSTNHKKDSVLPIVATKYSNVGRKYVQIHSRDSNSQTCNPQFFYSMQRACFHYFLGVTRNYAKCCVHFMFCWPCLSIDACYENQLDALFILGLFRQWTSTGFGNICSPSSGGILYMYNNRYVLCFLVDCRLANRQSTKKHNTYQFFFRFVRPCIIV